MVVVVMKCRNPSQVSPPPSPHNDSRVFHSPTDNDVRVESYLEASPVRSGVSNYNTGFDNDTVDINDGYMVMT